MIWQGAMMQYYTMEETDGIRTPQLTKYYMDQIIDNENKQDKLAVCSLLEAVIIGIKEKLPEFSKIILLSDSAGCYQNTLLMLFIPYLAYTHGTNITRFLHTETQDRKCVLDAHFALSMQGITYWCKEGSLLLSNNTIFTTNYFFVLPFRSRLCHPFASCDSAKVKSRATQLQR